MKLWVCWVQGSSLGHPALGRSLGLAACLGPCLPCQAVFGALCKKKAACLGPQGWGASKLPALERGVAEGDLPAPVTPRGEGSCCPVAVLPFAGGSSPLARPCLPLLCAQHSLRCAARHRAALSQRSFKNFSSREPMRRMHVQEVKAELSLDRLQLESLHKVRWLLRATSTPRSPGRAEGATCCPWGQGPGASAPSLLTPFSSHRCASAPTWTHTAGWCQAGRLASCGRTAWRGWHLAQTSSCCRSAVPASARCTGPSRAAPAPPQPPRCRPSSGGPLAATTCIRPQQQLGCLHCWVPGAACPSWCFLPGACPGEGWLLLAVTWDAQDARPHALGPEGSFLRSLV